MPETEKRKKFSAERGGSEIGWTQTTERYRVSRILSGW